MKRAQQDAPEVPEWTDGLRIEFSPEGKRPGTKSYDRYKAYSPAKTVAEALRLGAKRVDLSWDFHKKLLRVLDEQDEGATRKKPRGPTTPCAAQAVIDVGDGSPPRAVDSPAAATSLQDGVRLASGLVLPVAGFGTYKMKKGEASGHVVEALRAGYRLIDTAQVYDNEADVGAAIRASGVPRADVRVETKVWRSSHGYERTIKACNQSLRKLGLDYIDLYVIHWPGAKTGWPLPRGTICPKDWTPAMRNEGTWRAMEDLLEQGKVKAIGVTNYSMRHLKELLKTCRVKPMVNQVELHPRLVQAELLDLCRQEGIAVQAYASLGSSDSNQQENFFALPPVKAAAAAHGVTPAQVLLRWALEKGALVVPKSTKRERMVENGNIFSFKLTKNEVGAIDALHTGTRFAWKGLDPDSVE
mmetsp:Transcript_66806/g.206862  ORF Transcript_66806/g.206862 Transcript_66806/m.206862 type:complete len:414 (+) Transcript_66806:62-1303(+)|eukprot:CAMPEP_0204586656 /NCGR_PEP_ID=MMETSP0661-20131031/47621_1 /ASSEMBLY_ACC=CAM_ASM_000606 /TAXON_ID=109239 /ORGANISM="Alexandrium margalefi, Strain AMGDE01CS-322" /LENGTH=413 /DNA_ID=CAMNT_0051596313 /DNA_START=42 /DNA_END=1283 /DNA_ORIENTATION=+